MTTPASPPPKVPALAPDSNPFAVSHTDWVTIQVYVENTLHLPATDDAMAKTLQTDVDRAKEDFGDLSAIYAVMADHGTTWKNHTYPVTRGTAPASGSKRYPRPVASSSTTMARPRWRQPGRVRRAWR